MGPTMGTTQSKRCPVPTFLILLPISVKSLPHPRAGSHGRERVGLASGLRMAVMKPISLVGPDFHEQNGSESMSSF